MSDPLSFVVAEDNSLRLADFLKRKLPNISSKYHVRRCLEKEWITVNQVVRVEKSALLSTGDIVAVNATSFQMSQLRFREPLLQTVYIDDTTHYKYKVLFKPSGMPRDGDLSVTVKNALPASMKDEHYDVIDMVGRIVSGPVIVSFGNNDATRQTIMDVPKRYTFQLIVHGRTPDRLDNMPGFVALKILKTVQSTTGELSLVLVILTHSGDGLRGCLKGSGCPILGTAARTKSSTCGCYFACTKLELQWKDDQLANTIVDMELPEKFHKTLDKEQHYYDKKKQKETEEERQQPQLRSDYTDWMRGEKSAVQLMNQGHLSISKQWCVARFCGLSFYITDDVMSPKKSSELLVLAAKAHVKAEATVLDLGVGSGCLLVSTLVDAYHTAGGIGVDISTDALKIAEINVQAHGLSDRITLQQGDFNDLSFLGDARFDVVLCNPPYLTEGEMRKDRPSGPRVALVADQKGYACYEMIARQVASYLKPDGVVVLEVGGKRKVDEIRAIFRDLEHVETRQDNQGNDRCLVLRKASTIISTCINHKSIK